MTIWQKKGPESDIVLSVRLRIARNFNDIDFPTSMNLEDSVKTKNRILEMSRKLDDFNFKYYDFASISNIERATFIERHLCSKELSKSSQMSGLLLSLDESITIMMNEEDHIRAQILAIGLDYDEAYKKAKKILDVFDSNEKIAYKKDVGYLTSCPTNLGLGLRASTMIRIPAIAITGGLNILAKKLKESGFMLRGIYGEGTSSVGGIMQLSNSREIATTIGEVIEKVKSVSNSVVKAERVAKQMIIEKNNIRMQDKIMRAYGILLYAKRITEKELGLLLGDIWLGKDLGIIKDLENNDIMYLLTTAQDATLQVKTGEEKNKLILDMKRAEYIQEYIKQKEHKQ